MVQAAKKKKILILNLHAINTKKKTFIIIGAHGGAVG
jgi:hypothetical protein